MEHPSDTSTTERHETHDLSFRPPAKVERFAMGCVAVFLGLMAFWMAWIVATYLDGRGWFDFLVGLILHELILAIGVLSLVLLVWAVFAPPWITRLFEAASGHVVRAVVIFFVVLIAPGLLFALGGSLLAAFGIVK